MHNIHLPADVGFIIETLKNSGFSAYAVGGCVRDVMLGKMPYDWDVCTNAHPDNTVKIFNALGFPIIKTGIKHGTVTVVINKVNYEITTFRVDGEYEDFRRPDSVEFTDDLKLDLSRRDFTVNAMAYNPKTGVSDFFGGKEDLKNGIIKCVGDAKTRFTEDALRIMRALRFSAVLDFEIEENTAKAVVECAHLLKHVAPERINVELTKLLCGKKVKAVLEKFRDVFAVIIPEISDMFDFEQHSKYHIYDVWQHTVTAVENCENQPYIRLAMLLHDIAKPVSFTMKEDGSGHFYGHCEKSSKIAWNVLKRLKYDNKTVDTVCSLIKYHDTRAVSGMQIKKLLSKIGAEMYKLLLLVQEADAKAKTPKYSKLSLALIKEARENFGKIIDKGECYSIKMLDINGNDLAALGYKGKQIGNCLDHLLELVIEGKIENKKQEMVKHITVCPDLFKIV